MLDWANGLEIDEVVKIRPQDWCIWNKHSEDVTPKGMDETYQRLSEDASRARCIAS